jgi:hypothetical protein
MKRAIGLPATTARAPRKKRGFSLELAANAAGYIALHRPVPRKPGVYLALRYPAPRKPRVYLHVHPFGGAKPCFTTRHRRTHVHPLGGVKLCFT